MTPSSDKLMVVSIGNETGFTAGVPDPVALRHMTTEPEPDVCVLSSANARDAGSEDVNALLVVEGSDSSLRFDREDKSRIYAEADIAEYWIVNLVDDVLELYRDPKDGTYHERLVLKWSDTVSPLAFSDLEIAVSDLLP